MNNVFNPKRFCNYFLYDLKQTVARFGISLLIVGVLPVVIYLASGILSLVFSRQWSADPTVAQVSSAIAALVVVAMVFPKKVYGGLTDKKAGAAWAMIPASVPEKFISMLLVSLVVVPAAVLLMLIASNALMGLFVPGFDSFFSKILNFSAAPDDFPGAINVFAIFYVSLAISIMVFLLGSLVFKKSKIAKTLLCLMLLSCIISLIIAKLAMAGWEPDWDIFEWFETAGPEQIASRLNLWANLCNAFIFLLLGGGIYARMKTLKY